MDDLNVWTVFFATVAGIRFHPKNDEKHGSLDKHLGHGWAQLDEVNLASNVADIMMERYLENKDAVINNRKPSWTTNQRPRELLRSTKREQREHGDAATESAMADPDVEHRCAAAIGRHDCCGD